jgi:enoyl-CoA hydratase/carnithine racemase
MFARLLETLEAATADPSLRAVVLTGSGRAFCAGIDLKELAAGVERGTAVERPTVETIQQITRPMVLSDKIVVAAVNGPAVGFGAELAVAADIRIAAEEAIFAFPEVQRALFATGGSTHLLPRLVGLGRALDWLVSGRTVSAEEALAAGLVTRLVPGEDLLEVTLEEARRVAANAPIPVGRVKRLLRGSFDSQLEATLRQEVDDTLACLDTEDFSEGLRSFFEGRPPRFSGR